MVPTPTTSPSTVRRFADFDSLADGLDYAAQSEAGLNFFSGRGELISVLSYAELRERSIETARRLIGAGLEPGMRVILIADTDPDFLLCFFGCQYAGLIPAPVSLPMTMGGRDAYVEGLRRQIEICDASAAFAPRDYVGFLNEAADGLALRCTGTLSDIEEAPLSSTDLRPLTAEGPCYLQFSSGSTRDPRGIDIPQRSLMSNTYAISTDGLRINDQDRCVSWLPYYHDMGLVGFMLVPVLCQMSVDYINPGDFARRPLTWLRLISEQNGTLSFSPSFGYELCVRRASDDAASGLDLSSWRGAGIGGDMIQPNVLRDFAEAFASSGFSAKAFVPSYGLAEATLAASFSPLECGMLVDRIDRQVLADEMRAVSIDKDGNGDAREFVRCGASLAGHDFEIRDDAGAVVSERNAGRVMFRGPSVMAGYFRQPEETAEILSEDGWLDTGDIGYIVDGEIVVTGRRKDCIIINGRNIWPQDLEWAVEELPNLRRGDSAAICVDQTGDDEVVLLVHARRTTPENRDDLIRSVEGVVQRVAGIGCKPILLKPGTLPFTSSGKLSRARAKAAYLGGEYDTDAVKA